MAREEITLKQARRRFPKAIAALLEDDTDLKELAFTVDSKGALHVDDAVHPAFDDEWDPNIERWFGSGDDDEEEL